MASGFVSGIPVSCVLFFPRWNIFLSKNKIIRTSVLIPVICIVLLIFPVLGIADKEHEFIIGDIRPQMQQSLELFSYLHEFTDSNSIVVFPRARAMVLYGGRRTTYRLNHLTAEENDQLFEKLMSIISFFHWIQENMVCTIRLSTLIIQWIIISMHWHGKTMHSKSTGETDIAFIHIAVVK